MDWTTQLTVSHPMCDILPMWKEIA